MPKHSFRQSLKFLRFSNAILIILSLLISPFAGRVIPVQAAPLAINEANVALNVPAEVFIGEAFSFTATFDNLGSATGYGPFIDIILPATGMDGDDGISYVSASYLGSSLSPEPIVQTFPDLDVDPVNDPDLTGCVVHPYAQDPVGTPVEVCGNVGDQLITILLPFGSFVPTQPPAEVTINATLSNLADLGQPLPIQMRGGYQFGWTELGIDDPSYVESFSSANITPTLMALRKTYVGPESETATGPSFPRQYVVTADIANGQTLQNFELTDKLDGEVVYIDDTYNSVPTANTLVSEPIPGQPNAAPNNNLTLRWDSVTGVDADDARMSFSFYIGQYDVSSGDVLNQNTGSPNATTNDASALGYWDPIDPRDTATEGDVVLVTSDVTPIDHTLADLSIAVQKSISMYTDTGASGYSPGDTVQYTLTAQVSDYFSFNQVSVTDILSDGQRIVDGSITMSFDGNPFSSPTAPMDISNYLVTPNYSPIATVDPDGTTRLEFFISDELETRSFSPNLIGGCVPVGGAAPNCDDSDGPTQGVIRYLAVIQEEFSDDFPSGDSSVDQGDRLSNTVTVQGAVLDNTTFLPTGWSASNTSGASLTIAYGNITKSIHAVNGVSITPPIQVSPGDVVTYRITYTLPTGDVEDYELQDFLPLPIFDSTELVAFDAILSDAAPAAGHAHFTTTDTFFTYSNIAPVLTSNGAENSFALYFGDFDGPDNTSKTTDILFSVTVEDDPFADKLFLTNQVRAFEGSTNNEDQNVVNIVQLQLTEPLLEMRKGIVATNRTSGVLFSPDPAAPVTFDTPTDPAAPCPRFDTPITSTNLGTSLDSDISGLDAGDIITFALVVENIGSGLNGAFNVTASDLLPTGFTPLAGSVCVTDGVGTALPYTELGGGLFGDGIELTDSGTGSIRPFSETSGQNIAVITYDAVVPYTAAPQQVLTNTGSLVRYSGNETGPDFADPDLTDDATITITDAAIAKTLIQSEFETAGNTRNQLVIGEQALYEVTITVPEGVIPGAVLTDTLPAGLGFVRCESVTMNGVTSSLGSIPCPNPAEDPAVNPALSNNSTTITWSLGDLSNSTNSNSTAETITLRYWVQALNISANQGGSSLINNASLNGIWSASAPSVTIIEPQPVVQKNATINGGASGQAGDEVVYTIVVSNPNNPNAYEASLTDALPKTSGGASLILNPTITQMVDSDGTLTLADFTLSGDNATGWTLTSNSLFDLPTSASRTITIELRGTLSSEANLGEVITNTASLKFSSMDGDVTARTTYTTDSTERTGEGGVGTLNDYVASDPGSFNVQVPGPSKGLVSTSATHTDGTEIAIGETVEYQATFVIPQGTARNVVITDTLDPGLAFVSCDDIQIAGNLTTNDPEGFSCANAVISNVAGSPEAQNAGRIMTITLGDITNTDNDPDTETITITYTAVAINYNIASTYPVNNTVTGSWTVNGTPQTVTQNGPDLRIVEPRFTITKTANPATNVDANDLVTFTITLTNQSGLTYEDAFNVVWTDTVPATMTYVADSLAVSGVPETSKSDAGPLSVTWDTIGEGQVAIITFQARLNANVNPNQVITNTANVTYTTMPGTVTGLSTYNTLGCERTGNTADCGGAANDDNQNAQATVTVRSPAVAKTYISSSYDQTSGLNLTIGEEMEYQITVTLPEGVTNSLVITDLIPAGMQFVADSLTVTPDASITLPAPTSTTPVNLSADGTDGQDLVLNYGSITVDDDDVTTNNTILVRLKARVMNVANNHQSAPQTSLANQGRITAGGQTYNSSQVTSPVVEPILALTKTFTPADVVTDVNHVNDQVTISLRLRNTGGSPANEVTVSDTLPNNLFSNVTVTQAAGFTPSVVVGASDTVITFTGTIPAAGDITFQFTAQVDDIPTGNLFNNTAYVTAASSLPGTPPQERSYTTNGSATLTVHEVDLGVTKTNGVTSASAGQILTYNITVTNGGAYPWRSDNVEITETVPNGTTYTGTNGWVCSPDTNAGSTCTYALGTLNAGATSSPVPFEVTVDDPAAINLESIVNHTSVDYDEVYGPDRNPTNDTYMETDPLAADPSFLHTKTDALVVDADSSGDVSPGDTLEYTLTIRNDGDQDAANAIFTDTPGQYTSLVTGSVTTTRGSVITGNTSGDTSVRVDLGAMPGNGGVTATITFRVIIDGLPFPAGADSVANQGLLTYDTTETKNSDDPDSVPSDDPTVTPVNAEPDFSIVKSDADVTAVTGGNVTYTLHIENNGTQNATGVVVTETVPANTTFAASDPANTGWTCSGGGVAGSTCTYAYGDMAVGDTADLTFVVTVNATVPWNTDNLSNTASITDDGDNGADPTPGDNSDTEPTPLDAGPDMRIVKTDGDISISVGDSFAYTLTFHNDGDEGVQSVVLHETVPTYTTLDATAAAALGWSCSGTAAGSTCTFNVPGEINPGASNSIDFPLIADSTLPADVTGINNTASVSFDESNGEDPTDDGDATNNNTDGENTPIAASPVIEVTKTDNVMQFTPGSQLTYTITVTNTGSQDATGVQLTDPLAASTSLIFASHGGIMHGSSVVWPVFDLATGASVTRTLTVQISPEFLGTNTVNTAEACSDGSNGESEADQCDTATDTDELRSSGKSASAYWTASSFPQVSIGEIITYDVTLTVASGASLVDLELVDILDPGLALMDCQTVFVDAGLNASPNDFDQLCTVGSGLSVSAVPSGSADPADQGRRIEIDFGTVINSSAENGTITVRYRAVVLDSAANQRGDTLNNLVTWSWNGSSVGDRIEEQASAQPVTIIEPDLTLAKSVSPTVVSAEGGVVTYTLFVDHSDLSDSTAYDLVLTDVIPTGLTYVPGSFEFVSGQAPTALIDSNPRTLTATWNSFADTGSPTMLRFRARVAFVESGQSVNNTATLSWTSLPDTDQQLGGNLDEPQSIYNTLSTERFYDPGSDVNIYGASDTATFEVPAALPDTGFAPWKMTVLEEQPVELAYIDLAEDLIIEIPDLKVKTTIVGVPLVEGEWDLTWLGNKAGWLDGSAYPTWNGNSAITAHVYDANGKPGPFVSLENLKWGDDVLIHAYGKVYRYEVRSVKTVLPEDLSVLEHEDLPWLTLITCEGYDEASDEYARRIVVKAVLVEVK